MARPVSTSTCFSLVLLTFFVAMVMAAEKVCTVGPRGKLTMFNGETTHVTLPCKYRLADFTCCDFQVKVVPSSAADDEGRFNPDTLWLKVVNRVTGKNAVVRTSMAMLAAMNSSSLGGFKLKSGSFYQLGNVTTGRQPSFITFNVGGELSVELNRDTSTVEVKCFSHNFSSRAVPDTLCGDGTTTEAIEKAAEKMSVNNSSLNDETFLHYAILNDDTVMQSKACKGVASKFQSCDSKVKAARQCAAIFADPAQAQCLAQSDTPLENYYNYCLSSVCDGDASATVAMDNYLPDNCTNLDGSQDICPDEPWVYAECEVDADCGVSNAQCIGQKCRCQPGYFYSKSTKCCVETCQQLSDMGSTPQSWMLTYLDSFFTSKEGVLQEMRTDDANDCHYACGKNKRCVTIALQWYMPGRPLEEIKCTLYSVPARDVEFAVSHSAVMQRMCV